MADNTLFSCSKCDTQYPKWQGRCTECGGWSTLVELRHATGANKSCPLITQPLTAFTQTPEQRLATGIAEVDRALGGGLVKGSVILIGGEPGIGKSTLLLHIAEALQQKNKSLLYLSGEESGAQVALRAKRLGMKSSFSFAHAHDFTSIRQTLHEQPLSLAIVDSLQTITDPVVAGEAGSLAQVRTITAQLVALAKEKDITILLVGHVTKDGGVAGPKTLEHLVDCVAYLEGYSDGETRILRTVKNRFGACGEIGLFTMGEKGLTPLNHPENHFLEHGAILPAGSTLTATIDGTRSFSTEIQSLVAKTAYGTPQRRASGLDTARVQLIIALLTRKLKLPLGTQDVFVNAAGGIKITERASDAAIAASIISAFQDRALPVHMAVIGELGLSGEVRPVKQLDMRLKELERLGIKEVLLPKQKIPRLRKLRCTVITNLRDLTQHIRS